MVVAAPFGVNLLRAIAEAVALTVTDDDLASFANDRAVRFADDGPIAFAGFVAFAAQLINAAQRLSLRRQRGYAGPGSSRCDRPRLLRGRRRIAGPRERCGLSVRCCAGR